jgi:vanillate O-demethylase monooxygenase subunit
MRNFAPGDDTVSRQFSDSVRFAFSEDKIILEAVQKGIDRARIPPIGLKIDLGPTRFRRQMAKLIEEEHASATAEKNLAERTS